MRRLEEAPMLPYGLQRLPVRIMVLLSLTCLLAFGGVADTHRHLTSAATTVTANDSFKQGSSESGVPVALLQALCYMEGRLSNHGGTPSIDGGYGCLHLVKNKRANTLDQAASHLGVTPQQLQTDLPTNIRGGAAVLHDEAIGLSSTHALPATLGDWYGAVAVYSHASTRSTALMYADALYKILNSGFSASTDGGETVSLAPQSVRPNRTSASALKTADALPQGCATDNKVDYAGAVDCIVMPSVFDCNLVTSTAPCTYNGANRPQDFDIRQVVIHDVEGTAQAAISTFWDVNSSASVQYVVDTDGTVYQTLREKDIPFGAGNYWYNQHSINIEHAGFDATGFQWYNATEYLASAKLVAHLLRKYGIPLDHDHIVAHGTVPSPTLALTPNHVDPGPYWLWDYYFQLIHEQGVPYPKDEAPGQVVTLHPSTARRPLGRNGTETPANFNFFYLYKGPSTTSGLIPQLGNGSDVTDVSNNIEPDISYAYLQKTKDPAGTGDTMYQIWYGEFDKAHADPPSKLQTAQLAWLAIPRNAAAEGRGVIVRLTGAETGSAEVFGRPTTNDAYHIGDAPSGSVFVSAYMAVEDGTTNRWYEINFNHRQAWVPESEVLT
jgi:N-acetylmuramoyl-L-alanine amidase-like protein